MSAPAPTFTLTAPPSTDLWTKPPRTFSANPTSRTHSRLPLRSFKRARIGISAAWVYQYDQGGLLLRLHPAKSAAGGVDASGSGSESNGNGNWIKVGVEFYHGRPYCSTVGTDRWSDWSIYPVNGEGEVVVEVVKEGDELGNSLWVYLVKPGGDNGAKEERFPVREICWACADLETEVEVGAYCCRPGEEGGELKVGFRGFVVERVEGE